MLGEEDLVEGGIGMVYYSILSNASCVHRSGVVDAGRGLGVKGVLGYG